MIGLTWSPGAFDGGSTVIDYRVSFDQSNNNYITLQAGVLTASYSATGLTGGSTYKFKIEARNTVGYSLYS